MRSVSRSYDRGRSAYSYRYDPLNGSENRIGHSAEQLLLSVEPRAASKILKKHIKRTLRRKRSALRITSYILLCLFAVVGITFTGVFVGMQYHIFNVEGSSISRDSFFKTLPKVTVHAASVSHTPTAVSCVEQLSNGAQVPVCIWNKSPEYAVIRDGLYKDRNVINLVAQQTGVSSRMIAATVVPEQLRWFTTDREDFKKIFEPLKILGVAANMTYGIGGFHYQTAQRVEQYTKDTNSPFYAGPGMAQLVAYPSVQNPRDTNLLARLSDSTDHYYSYLYVALFIKEITNQWESAGYDISNRPDVIITLYNIGFDRSIPKPNPQIGGATINVDGTNYTYGELGVDFYYSDELTQVFPMAY